LIMARTAKASKASKALTLVASDTAAESVAEIRAVIASAEPRTLADEYGAEIVPSAQSFRVGMVAQVDLRIASERKFYDDARTTAKERDVIDKKCHKLRTYLANALHDDCVDVMQKAGVDVAFINGEGTGNIYTAKKVYELASFLAKRDYKPCEYDVIAFVTMLNCHNAGVIMTREHVQNGICHDLPATAKECEFSHRLAGFHKDMSTAKAQDTSSLGALEIFGIVRNVNRGKVKRYELNVDSYATKRFAELLGITLA
jgi:hypothetical protein